MRKNIHVTRRKDGNWAVKGEGDNRASGLYPTEREATDVGRELARKNKSELFIHDRENKIRDRDIYGGDPFPPRDKRH
jgi:hypothetical protein